MKRRELITLLGGADQYSCRSCPEDEPRPQRYLARLESRRSARHRHRHREAEATLSSRAGGAHTRRDAHHERRQRWPAIKWSWAAAALADPIRFWARHTGPALELRRVRRQ
jgi:hypothetical protein